MSDIKKPDDQQENHDPMTEEDTASGGPADPPSGGHD